MSRRAAHTPDQLERRRADPAYVPPAAQPRLVTRPKYERRETGLMVLFRAERLDARQVRALERYGSLWRESQIEGEAAMKSSMAALENPGGGSVGGGLPSTTLISAEAIVETRRALHAAQQALGFEMGLVAACDAICGRQFLVSEVTKVRRESEAIGTLLWTAGNLLAKHFGG